MSVNERERQALGSIEHDLAGSDPALASMLGMFSRLTSGEEMPADEKILILRGRPAAYRLRRARRHTRRGIAFPQARRLYARAGLSQAMLLLWVIISVGLLAVALVLNNSGHKACIRSMGTACPSPSSLQHADASPVDEPAASRGGLPAPTTDQPRIVPLDRQARMTGNTGPRANGGPGSPHGRLPAVSAAQAHS